MTDPIWDLAADRLDVELARCHRPSRGHAWSRWR